MLIESLIDFFIVEISNNFRKLNFDIIRVNPNLSLGSTSIVAGLSVRMIV
jgi:hypothetical protein